MRCIVFKRKIVYKITLGYVIIVLITLCAIGIFFITSFRDYTFKSKENNMQTRAKEIARVTEPYLIKKADISGYDNFMELLDSFSNARIWITDKNGNIITMSNGEFCTDQGSNECNLGASDREMISNVLSGENVIKEGYGTFYNEFMLTVGVPVKDDKGDIVGTVFLHSPVSGITSTVDRTFYFLMAAIIVALLLTGVLGVFYSSLITKPIKTMNKSAMEMTRGNYDIRTNIRQKDEIGQLGNSLDLLASKLGYTIDQLFQERNKLNDVITSISEGILAFDVNMKLINHNQALIKLFEYNYNDSVEDNVKRDLQEHGLWDEFKTVVDRGKGSTVVVDWNIRKLKFTLSPVKNNTGEIIGVVALIQDISESERLEQMRREFVTNVSHEFRTPLTLIRGSVEALIDATVTDGDTVKKYHTRIFNEAKGLERLVKDLLDLGKLQTGKFDLQLEKVDIIQLLADVSRSIKPIADKKGIVIENSFKEGIPPVIGDYDRLRQLFVIFIDNAIKYSNENTNIHISAGVSGYVYVKIRDNGIGIPKEDLPYIWDRFYKVDKSRSRPESGTGLGLSIARYLIEAHKGIVRVESEMGKGTTIEVGLPFEKEKEALL